MRVAISKCKGLKIFAGDRKEVTRIRVTSCAQQASLDVMPTSNLPAEMRLKTLLAPKS